MSDVHHTITTSPDDTQALAAQIAAQLAPGSVLRLDGPLGAGKTCFVQGLARGLGVSPQIRIHSPTFTLMNIYHGRLPLYHFDWYRLERVQALTSLDLDEYFDGTGISVVEWGEKFPAVFPARTAIIRLTIHSVTERDIIMPASFSLTRGA